MSQEQDGKMLGWARSHGKIILRFSAIVEMTAGSI